jgi:hypothetical protein
VSNACDAEVLKLIFGQRRGHEMLRVTAILLVLAHGRKLPPFIVLRRKNLPQEKLPSEIILKCNKKDSVTRTHIQMAERSLEQTRD